MMDIKDFNPDFFIQQLEDTLSCLRQEIAEITSSYAVSGSIDELDKYIFEINSFYFQSFQNKVFPLYKNSVQEEVTRLLRINRQEVMIKKDIMANIKRYAHLYNQIKNIMAFLIKYQKDTSSSLLNLKLEYDYRTAELLYILREIGQDFTRLRELTGLILNSLKNLDSMALLNHPAALSAINFMSSQNLGNPAFIDALNRLLAYLVYLAKNLSRMQLKLDKDSRQMIQGIVKDMKERYPDWGQGDESEACKYYYDTQIEPVVSLYINILGLSFNAKDIDSYAVNLRNFEKWITGLIQLMEKSAYSYFPAISKLFNFHNFNLDFIQKFYDDINNMEKTFTSLSNELSDSSQPDFAFFYTRTCENLQPALPLLKEALVCKELACFPELNNALRNLELKLELMTARISLIDRHYELNNRVYNLLSGIIKMLDNYLNILGNNKSDLERILAPHNITRAWKDAAIQVVRIPLEKGKLFPFEYLYLLDKHQVETRITSAEDNMILETEGDIFIIRVDELLEEEIPYFIVAQKG